MTDLEKAKELLNIHGYEVIKRTQVIQVTLKLKQTQFTGKGWQISLRGERQEVQHNVVKFIANSIQEAVTSFNVKETESYRIEYGDIIK